MTDKLSVNEKIKGRLSRANDRIDQLLSDHPYIVPAVQIGTVAAGVCLRRVPGQF
jgi:hypothetical protein